MRETMIVMRRELRSYFLSPIAYVFGGLFLLAVMWLTALACLGQGLQTTAAATNFFALLPWAFLLFLPALTMRLWSEERKLGTLELLLTFPVRIRQLVAGKFLAVLAYLAVILGLTGVFPVLLAVHGDVDWGPLLGGYAAAMLLAAAFVAVGMFWSAITRDQIIAMLLSAVTLIALWLLGWPVSLAYLGDWFGLPDIVVGVCAAGSPYRYFQSIVRGVVDTGDIVYYACFCGFFLYANALVLHGRRLKG